MYPTDDIYLKRSSKSSSLSGEFLHSVGAVEPGNSFCKQHCLFAGDWPSEGKKVTFSQTSTLNNLLSIITPLQSRGKSWL